MPVNRAAGHGDLLSTPPACVQFKHPLMELFRPGDFLSKCCLGTFGGYARSQVKKAAGSNTKIQGMPEKPQGTLTIGKNYDAKHMMHTFRVLNMAQEIAETGRIVVHREDRDFLLRIRGGEFEYEESLKMVDDKMDLIERAFQRCDLPDAPDVARADRTLVRIREQFYKGGDR